jgi:hypothetical protein
MVADLESDLIHLSRHFRGDISAEENGYDFLADASLRRYLSIEDEYLPFPLEEFMD